MTSNFKENDLQNDLQSVEPARFRQIQLLSGFSFVNAATLKYFKMLLLLCVLSCSGIILTPQVNGQNISNDLNIIPVRRPETLVQILTKRQSPDWFDYNLNNAPQALTISDSQTPSSLAQSLVGTGVTISNVTYTGTTHARGSFSGGTGIIGFEDGIVLSSGDIRNIIGPNNSTAASADNGTAGDTNLTAIVNAPTFDAAVLQFNIVPDTNILSFQYVFGSEEYNEFVNGSFNDVFAFFVNGTNIALVPGTTTAVSINTINGGKPLGTNSQNPQFYRNNDFQDGTAPINTQLDGLTVVLNVQVNVIPNQINTIKLAIADTADHDIDSAVLIRSGSVSSLPATILSVAPASGTSGGTTNLSATLKTTNNQPVANKTINFTLLGTPVGNAVTNTNGVATLNNVSLANITPNTYPIGVGASFDGDTNFNGSSGSNSLTVTNCPYSLNPTSSPNIPAIGGQFSFFVTTNAGCPVSASSNVSWLATSISTNGGTTTVVYSVDQNPDMSPRTGTITVGDQTFTVNQAAASCPYSINPTSASVAAGGGTGNFALTTTSGCTWSAVSNVNWLITSGSGSGNGTILYTATANTAASSRIGRITVGGQTFTLTQAAAPACTYSISPTSDIVEATSGTYSFNVFATAGCSWTATTSTSWITTTASGTGNGTAHYTVAANTGTGTTPRQGAITVNGQAGNSPVFTVNQKNPVITTYSISGRVTSTTTTNGGDGLSGVTITLSGQTSAETITDSNGNYRFNNLTPANYAVIPSLPGVVFTPAVSNIPFLDRNQTADFLLDVCTYRLLTSSGEATKGIGVPTEDSSGGFVVNASSGCGTTPWQAISNAPWIIVSNGGIGAGTAPVGYFVQRNYGAARSGVIAVNGQLYTIVQREFQNTAANKTNSPQVDAPCGTVVSNSATNSLRRQVVPFMSGSGSFEVKTINQGNLSECKWTAVAEYPQDPNRQQEDPNSPPPPPNNWLTVVTKDGLNDKTVSFTVEQNTTLGPRFGLISVNGEKYTIVQTARQANCNFTLTPSFRNYPSGAGAGSDYSFSIAGFSSSNPPLPCRWTPFIDPFIENSLGVDEAFFRAGLGTGTRSFTIKEANTGTKTKEGSIVVGDKTFTIIQAAGTNCQWAFTSRAEDISAGGASGRQVNVVTGTGCNWTAAATDSWIHFTGGVGTANGTVSFNVDQNTGTTARAGRISITQDSSVFFTITQAAAQTCSYTIDPGFQSVLNNGAAGTIQVTASDSCTTQQWSAVSNDNWITITSGASGRVGSGSTSFVAQANPTPVQRSGTITVAGRTFTVNQAAGNIIRRTSFDFDGDGRADISVFRPADGVWYLSQSTSGFTGMQFGIATDKLVPADYDGDGKTDLAVYRNGTWYLQRSTLGFTGIAFGEATDIAVPGDYDGDGKADIAVWRPSNGVWYVYNLANNQVTAAQFGASTDKPVVGDFNGDGKSDYAVFRPSNGFWYIARATGTPSQNFDSIQFGSAEDKPIPADYDGDGKTDVAVFRPSNGTWYLNRSQLGFTGIQFGFGTDLPTPADYDGDGKADMAVFRNGTWYLQRSTSGFTGVQFGASTDSPVPNAFVP